MHNMDDWKLKARAVVKLKKKHNMFVSSCPVLFLLDPVIDRVNVGGVA